MTTATNDVILTAVRCAAFGGKVGTHDVSVSWTGIVRVYDNVAGYFTTCHSLSKAAERRIRKLAGTSSEYRFATDSESGTLQAGSFADAKRQLRAMLPPAAVADGGFGWVADHNGDRFEIG